MGSEEVGSVQSAVGSDVTTSIGVDVHFEVDGAALEEEVGSRQLAVGSDVAASIDVDVYFEVDGAALEEEVGSEEVGSGQWAVDSDVAASIDVDVHFEVDSTTLVEGVEPESEEEVESDVTASIDVNLHFEIDRQAETGEIDNPTSEIGSAAETNTAVEMLPPVPVPAPAPSLPVRPEATTMPSGETRISAFSLSGLKARKELEKQHAARPTGDQQLPTEPFNETDLMLQWNKYAQRLGDKGQKIMESLMLIADPKLDGTRILHELPNGSAAGEFEDGKLELLGYLRGKLHNHDITIDVIINEKMDNRRAFTTQDKYNRLNEINPNLDLLRRTFDLDVQ